MRRLLLVPNKCTENLNLYILFIHPMDCNMEDMFIYNYYLDYDIVANYQFTENGGEAIRYNK